MELKMKNIGALYEETRIRFDGITVLAGENACGKSTIGKALFCMFNSLSNLDERIYNERLKSVAKSIRDFLKTDIVRNRHLFMPLSESIVSKFYENNNVDEALELLKNDSLIIHDKDGYEDLIIRIREGLGIPDKIISDRIVKERLLAEFGNSLPNVNYYDEESVIEINIKDHFARCRIINGTVSVEKDVEIAKDATYIGNSLAIDHMAEGTSYGVFHTHESDLYAKLTFIKDKDSSIVNDVLLDSKLEDIINQMESAGVGDIVWEKEKGWVYIQDNLKGTLGIENISSGLKGFIQIKQLIKNGWLEEKGVLILDEPEIHLHPEWQKIFAEIIVKLQSEFNLTVLLSTHSVDFLSFVEYYVKIYKKQDLSHYYLLTKNSDGVTSVAEETTGDLNKIYEKLSMPYLRVVEELNSEE